MHAFFCFFFPKKEDRNNLEGADSFLLLFLKEEIYFLAIK